MFPSVRVSEKQERLPLIHTALHLPLLLLGLILDGTGWAVHQCPSAPQLILTGPDFWFCHTSYEVATLRKSLWHWIRGPNPPLLAESRVSVHPSAGQCVVPFLQAGVTGPLESPVTPAGRRAFQWNATTILAGLVKRKVTSAIEKWERLATTLENPASKSRPAPGLSISWRANAFDLHKSGPALNNKLSSGEAELFTPVECECWFRAAGSGLLIHSAIWGRRSCSTRSIGILVTLCCSFSAQKTILRVRQRSYRWHGMRTRMEIRSSWESRMGQTLLCGFTGCSCANRQISFVIYLFMRWIKYSIIILFLFF